MRTWQKLVSVAVGVLLAAGCGDVTKDGPQLQKIQFQKIAKWAVGYDDESLGHVEGVAFCAWSDLKCHVKLRDPKSGALLSLNAEGLYQGSNAIQLPEGDSDRVRMVLRGKSPSSPSVAAPAAGDIGLNVDAGEDITVTLKNGEVTQTTVKKVSGSATPDRDLVRLDLELQPDASLDGHWSYLADPITERDAAGSGRVGVFSILRDEDIPVAYKNDHPVKPGGFMGRQSGAESWDPLPPRIVAVLPLEDQAGFEGPIPKYHHASNSTNENADNIRTLIVIGRDLPVDGDKAVLPLYSDDPGVSYEVVSVAGTDNVRDEDKPKFERAWLELTRSMTAEEQMQFRKLDAVLVKAKLTFAADAGPKTVNWGTATSQWDLQYGDNTAALSFVRIIDESGKTEPAAQMALPEQVFLQVETGNAIAADQIPVQIGGPAIATPLNLIASKVPGKAFLFRTPALVFLAPGEVAPKGGQAIT